jgi:hypothetical protein
MGRHSSKSPPKREFLQRNQFREILQELIIR